jgi:hypothetical protein
LPIFVSRKDAKNRKERQELQIPKSTLNAKR